jgi:hypothetical protein
MPAAARRAPRSFRRVRSSMYGWRTSRWLVLSEVL